MGSTGYLHTRVQSLEGAGQAREPSRIAERGWGRGRLRLGEATEDQRVSQVKKCKVAIYALGNMASRPPPGVPWPF